MTDPQVGVLMLALFVFVIMLGFPIAFSLMAMGVGFAFYYFDFREAPVFALVVRKTFEVMSNEVLLPVPLFLFMGYLVERADILNRLFRSIQVAAKNTPASLAVATLATCALFATATGVSFWPVMLKVTVLTEVCPCASVIVYWNTSDAAAPCANASAAPVLGV